MIAASFPHLREVLCLGAHADDIEIGCAGTLLTWLAQCPELRITWVVWSASGARRDEAQRSAEAILSNCKHKEIYVESFRDAYFPSDWGDIKERMGQIAASSDAEVVFTHRLEDRHQDHRVIGELTWNAFRDQMVLEYEIPKYEGDLSPPNFYVPLAEEVAERKIKLLHKFFPTQTTKDWFADSTFHALMRIRGLEARAPSGMAEAFHGRKISARCT